MNPVCLHLVRIYRGEASKCTACGMMFMDKVVQVRTVDDDAPLARGSDTVSPLQQPDGFTGQQPADDEEAAEKGDTAAFSHLGVGREGVDQ